MSLMIATSRPLRDDEELNNLVHAVEMADAEDENEWIEWKSHLALSERKTQATLARHIVAMANRRVDEASRYVDGFGYILVGVEPRNRCGVQRVDFAVLRAGIERYLGSDGPRWTARYVSTGERSVLVVIVDPPRYGDPIYVLERDFEDSRRGDVYVRKLGSTERADPDDLAYLTRRAGRVATPDFLQWAVEDFPPSAAGVHKAVAELDVEDGDRVSNLAKRGEWWDLPPYIERDHDVVLGSRLAAAADADGGLVVVTGRSCTGKTRSVWEAVRSNRFCGWRVVRPTGAGSLRALMTGSELRPQTFLWLDELQYFLAHSIEQQGLAADDLRALWTRCSPVVVIGTMWPDVYDTLAFGVPARPDQTGDQARGILKLARDPVRIPDRLGEAELGRALQAAPGSSLIRRALADPDHGMTQVLAGAPWLIQRWEQPRFPFTRSVLGAAAAAWRLGVREPASAELLRDAARSYFPDRRPAPQDWFTYALSEATELIRDAVSALVPDSDPYEDQPVRYKLTEYLAQHSADGQAIEPVPEGVWQALATHITDPSDLLTLAYSAFGRLLYKLAESFFRRALAAGEESARSGLLHLFISQERFDEAVELERAASRDGESGWMANVLQAAGRVDELRALAETDSYAASILPQAEFRRDRARIAALAKHGHIEDLRELTETGDSEAFMYAVDLLGEQGRTAEAIDLARRRRTDEVGAKFLWRVLVRHGRVDEAIEELRHAVGVIPDAAETLVGLLFEYKRADDLRELADDDPHALVNLARLLRDAGHINEAIELLRRSDLADPCWCPTMTLAALLAESGHVDEAVDKLRQVQVRLPWNPRPFRPEQVDALLARLLAEHGRHEELQQMADESPSAYCEWARVLAANGRIDEAAECFRLAAPWLDYRPLLDLGLLLADHNRVEEAFEAMVKLSEPLYTGNSCARLAAALAEKDRIDDLRRAAVGHRSARLYLAAVLAVHHSPEELGKETVSGDTDSREVLRVLAFTGYLANADALRRFGLNPDGTIALDHNNNYRTIPATITAPKKSNILQMMLVYEPH